MLLLKRRVGESIVIGGSVRVTVSEVRGGTVRLAIQAPSELPVYRGELVDVVAPENERALGHHHSGEVPVPLADAVITFPNTIPGLGAHKDFLLYDVSESLRALVARDDRTISMLLTDPTALCADYPVEDAMARFPFKGTELAVAVVLCRPADGSMPTVNLAAPIVIDIASRKGAQVILDNPDLPVRAPLISTTHLEVHTL